MGKGKGPPVLLSYLLVLLELPRLCLPPWAALAESSCSPTTGINRLLREIGPCRQGTSLAATFTPQLLSLPTEGSRPPSLSLFLHCMWRGKLLSIEIFRTWSGVWEQANQAWPSSDLVCGAEAPHSQTHRPVGGGKGVPAWLRHSQHRRCWRRRPWVLLRARPICSAHGDITNQTWVHTLAVMPGWALSSNSPILSPPV